MERIEERQLPHLTDDLVASDGGNEVKSKLNAEPTFEPRRHVALPQAGAISRDDRSYQGK